MKSRIWRILSIALVLSLLLCAIPAEADKPNDDGWISITIGNNKSAFERKGISFAIYLVATGNYGDWTMQSHFSDIKVYSRDDGSTYINKSLAQIKKRISDQGIRATASGKTNGSGKVEFKNLQRGIY